MVVQENIGEQHPLTVDEHELLTHIYQKRFRFFIGIYLFLIGVAFFSALSISGRKPRLSHMSYTSNGYHYDERKTGLSHMQMYGITIPLLEGLVIGTGILVYRKRIRPLRKDAKNGVKETIHYPITQKQNFQQTGQYFIGTNHPDYLFHEVDYETWQQVNVGDSFAVYRAPLSKYVFNGNGKYSIM
ncbi:MAG: hypothetical protein WC756_10885 [Taibaiella sp.]|jgi:hypothetical protein